jgi:hypothetical protein
MTSYYFSSIVTVISEERLLLILTLAVQFPDIAEQSNSKKQMINDIVTNRVLYFLFMATFT